jgi:hypothetical protein
MRFFKKKKKVLPLTPPYLQGVPFIAGVGNVRSYIRRDLSDHWSEVNPILEKGELAYEVDTQRIGIGDGVNRWQDLPKATFPPRGGDYGTR